MAEAAMEAYDGTEQAADMVDPDWANVPAAYRASRWHGLFADTPDEFRSSLSWCGRFAGITNAVNCYSETEDVVGNPKGQAPALTDPVWVVQESLNGAALVKSVNIWPWLHIGCEGGWGRNAHYPLRLTAGSMLGLSDLTREDVIEHPLFTPFRNETERMSSTNLFSVTDTAATPELRARFLADAIPAESHAAGANAFDENVLANNVSLMGQMSNNNRWPEKDDDNNPIWKHSAFKQVAYFFTYRLFDKFVKEN